MSRMKEKEGLMMEKGMVNGIVMEVIEELLGILKSRMEENQRDSDEEDPELLEQLEICQIMKRALQERTTRLKAMMESKMTSSFIPTPALERMQRPQEFVNHSRYGE